MSSKRAMPRSVTGSSSASGSSGGVTSEASSTIRRASRLAPDGPAGSAEPGLGLRTELAAR